MKKDQNNNNTIWKFFYKKEDKKPKEQEDFIEALSNKDVKNYLLTNGMENFVKIKLKKSFTKTQMRNIFNLLTDKSEEQNPTKLHVKLIYIAGKADNWDAKNFIRLLFDIYQNDTALAKEFIESALAYHKFYATK